MAEGVRTHQLSVDPRSNQRRVYVGGWPRRLKKALKKWVTVPGYRLRGREQQRFSRFVRRRLDRAMDRNYAVRAMSTINGHTTRISMDASTYDEICTKCGATDGIGTLGGLAKPCPVPDPEPAPAKPAAPEWAGYPLTWGDEG